MHRAIFTYNKINIELYFYPKNIALESINKILHPTKYNQSFVEVTTKTSGLQFCFTT